MVINSTNINKTNNHLSPRERLNSDGHQFHQYQQNKQSSLVLIEHTGHKKTMTYNVGNRGHGLGQAQTCGGVKLVTGIPIIPLDNWSSIQQYI